MYTFTAALYLLRDGAMVLGGVYLFCLACNKMTLNKTLIVNCNNMDRTVVGLKVLKLN